MPPQEIVRDIDAQTLRPLVVDLDGTLVKTDLLFESYFGALQGGIRHHHGVLRSLRQGKARLKAYLAAAGRVGYATLPYDPAILDLLRAARKEGRRTVLATASDEVHARAIADHLGLFDEVVASDGVSNLAGAAKAQRLVELFGRGGFDYVGNGPADLAVWAEAAEAYAIRPSPRVRRALDRLGKPVHQVESPAATLRLWLRAIRAHQYTKNLLVFVPLLASHQFTASPFLSACLAFLAFSACASGVYLLNDLVDLAADRDHPTKKERPLASGAIPIATGVALVPAFFCLAAVLAFTVSPAFAGTLAVYLGLTTAYSLYLKRKMLVDIVVLAMLYTIIFTSLALIKRYVELTVRADAGLEDPTSRNYKKTDAEIVAMLAAGSGMNAVTIFSLYVSSSTVQELYSRPALLWLICPILLFWISRALLMAHRRLMHDDPILFAIRDRNSQLAAVLIAGILFLAL